jgi:hypothetical protein
LARTDRPRRAPVYSGDRGCDGGRGRGRHQGRVRLRQRSDAFVITNAVKIEGHSMSEEMAETSIESIKSFDILASILAELNEQEQEVVKGLLKC